MALRQGLITFAALVLLAACSDGSTAPQNKGPAPPAEGTIAPSQTWTDPYPYPEGTSGSGVTAPAGVSDSQRQADVEDCYNYARSQVAHDVQIQDDRAGIFTESSRSETLYYQMQKMTDYENEQHLDELYHSCMRSKGYSGW